MARWYAALVFCMAVLSVQCLEQDQSPSDPKPLENPELSDKDDVIEIAKQKSDHAFENLNEIAGLIGEKAKLIIEERVKQFQEKVNTAAKGTKELITKEAEIIENTLQKSPQAEEKSKTA